MGGLPSVSIDSQEEVPKVYLSGAWQYPIVFLDAVQLLREIASSHEIREAEPS